MPQPRIEHDRTYLCLHGSSVLILWPGAHAKVVVLFDAYCTCRDIDARAAEVPTPQVPWLKKLHSLACWATQYIDVGRVICAKGPKQVLFFHCFFHLIHTRSSTMEICKEIGVNMIFKFRISLDILISILQSSVFCTWFP